MNHSLTKTGFPYHYFNDYFINKENIKDYLWGEYKHSLTYEDIPSFPSLMEDNDGYDEIISYLVFDDGEYYTRLPNDESIQEFYDGYETYGYSVDSDYTMLLEKEMRLFFEGMYGDITNVPVSTVW